MFSFTFSVAFAFSCLFFVVCAAENSFPVILKRFQGNLHAANQSLATWRDDSAPAFGVYYELESHISAARLDVSILRFGVADYPASSNGSLKDALTVINDINLQFVSLLKSMKAEMIQADSESIEGYAFVLTRVLRLFKTMIVNVFDPFANLLVEWSSKSSGLNLIEKFFWSGFFKMERFGMSVDFLKLTPVLLEIQQDERMGEEVRKMAADVIESICRIRVEMNCAEGRCDGEVVMFNQFCDVLHIPAQTFEFR